MTQNTCPVLQVRDFSLSFSQYKRGFTKTQLPVITDLSVSVNAGQLVAVVGASGSGKSLLAHAILGLLPYNASWQGEMLWQGQPLTQRRMEALRGREMVLVPQSVASLDPLMQVGPFLRRGKKDAAARALSRDTLARYGLDAGTEKLYPFELSGGMARRVLISSAVMEQPKLVIADEPTPGLHIDAAKRVLRHFREMADAGAGVLLITHDLELAQTVADRIVVFYAGTTVEEAAAADFAAQHTLRHPYTRALWRAMPQHGMEALPGTQPYAGQLPEGCVFGPRCPHHTAACDAPVTYRPLRGGFVRCCRAEEVEA